MLERDGTQVFDMKKEELQQRIYTLKKFTEPMDLKDQNVRNFEGKTALNVAIWIVLIVLVIRSSHKQATLWHFSVCHPSFFTE